MQKPAALDSSALLKVGNFLSGKNMLLVLCLILFFISAIVFFILWIFDVPPIHYPSIRAGTTICLMNQDESWTKVFEQEFSFQDDQEMEASPSQMLKL